MWDERQRKHLDRVATTLQIITAALATGIVIFAVVVMLITAGPGKENAQPVITIIGIVATLLALVAGLAVPRIMTRRVQRALVTGKLSPSNSAAIPADLGEVGLLAGIYQTRTILGHAIFEGAAFLNLMAYMMEGQIIALACAALLLVAIVSRFPTRGAIENWIGDELKSIEELRALEG